MNAVDGWTLGGGILALVGIIAFIWGKGQQQ